MSARSRLPARAFCYGTSSVRNAMASEQAPASDAKTAPKRKSRRMGVPSTVQMDETGAMALSLLKSEALAIRTTGIAGLLTADQSEVSALLHPYLSSKASKPHEDPSGEKHGSANEEHHKPIYTDSATGTKPLALNKEWALNAYCNTIEHLKIGDIAADKSPKFYLDSNSGAVPTLKKSGGFQQLYAAINVPKALQNKSEQDRCIFAMTRSQFVAVGGPPAARLIEEAKLKVQTTYHQITTVKEVHVLFHWNAHSFFQYHQDHAGEVTVIINLSFGKAYMHVAGRKEAEYDGPGSAHMFPSQVFHRSGEAERRCVKIALFFDLGADVDQSAEDAGSSSTDVKPEDKPVVDAQTREDTTC